MTGDRAKRIQRRSLAEVPIERDRSKDQPVGLHPSEKQFDRPLRLRHEITFRIDIKEKFDIMTENIVNRFI